MAEVKDLSWDLTVLFENFDDPQIAQTIECVTEGAKRIEQDFKGKINRPETTPLDVLEVFKRAETLLIDLFEVYAYAELSFATDQSNKQAAALNGKADKLVALYRKHIAFFELEMGELLEERGEEFLNSPVLAEFHHYLEKIAEKRPFKLSEPEEKLILEKNLFGIKEWENLQRRWVATRSFTLLIDGEEKELSWSSGRGFFYHPSREVRKEAYKALLGGLGKDADLFATALRNVCADYVADCCRRGYSNPMVPSLITNDITQEILDNMINVVESNVNIFQDFLLLKAKLLGARKLRGEDLLAPLPDVGDRKITWTEAKEMIIDCYSEFDTEFGSIARSMFEKKRIDAAPRPSKVAGAFCGAWYKGKSAFVLQSFNERINDVQTLAHELGHAVHAHLAAEKQPVWNRVTLRPMGLAETASEFGSMLFTDKILRDAPDGRTKREILFNALERILTVVFEVSSRVPFEQSLYAAIEQDEFLEPEKINELLWEARNQYFGDVIDWLPEQVYHWCWKPHYYDNDRRFYNYPYVFGELLVLALYKKYREEGATFVPKYKAFLAAGGSISPQELVKTLGADLAKREFWEDGMDEIKRLLAEFKALINQQFTQLI
ncbi:MAG: M3 family oligoendopeptidase [Candidatus Hodarchaeota archaeon]